MIRVSGQSTSRPVKAAGAEEGAQQRNQKLHAAMAKNAFWSQTVQNTSAPKHFLYLRYRKIARRCNGKHISKSKCTKHHMLGAHFQVLMSKNCTPLWREALVQVNMLKNWGSFWSSDVEKLHAMYKTPHGWSTFWSSDVEICTPLWGKAHHEVKMYKTRQQRTVFSSSDVEKLHDVSQDVQITCVLARFFKFRCQTISQVVS